MAKAKAKKEPLKKRCPYKYYRNAYWGFQSAEWAAVIAPIIAVFGVKWNEYFDFVNNQGESVRLTIGCVLAIVCGCIFVYKKARHQEKTEHKVSMLTYVLGVGVAWAIVFFCKAIIDDLFLILSCELGGAVVAFGLDFETQEMRRKEIVYRNARENLEAEEAAKEERKRKAVE